MAFGGLIQTTLGRNLSTRSKLGTPMTFTHIAIGDGHYSGSYNDITHLTNSLFTLPAAVTMVGDNALLEVDLNNSGITTGYYFREIGVYASDGTNSVLYAYDNAGSDAQLIQSGGGAVSIAKRIRLVLTELADANVVIDNVDALYVTFEELAQNLSGYATEEELAALEQSKADKTELAKKANIPMYVPVDADLDSYLTPGEYYLGVGGETVANKPYPEAVAFSLKVELNGSFNNSGVKHTWSSHDRNDTYTRVYHAGSFSNWKRFSTATSPHIKDFVLLNGVTTIRRSTYKKLQENVGIAVLSIAKATNGLTPDMHVATLIDGYRPAFQSEGILVGSDFSGNPIIGNMIVNTDGRVILWTNAPANLLFGICVYDI